MSEEYDVIVIGAGPVGENVADRAVQGGLSAVIVESELVGGECSYWACMPSKALLRSGEAVRAARAVDGAAQAVSGAIDVDAVLRRRDGFTSHWDDAGQVSWLDDAGISLVRGHAEITGDREVTVHRVGADAAGGAEDDSARLLRARHAVVVATGSAALLPDIPGLAEAGAWTHREATAAEAVPGRLAVIGGGVVATELATAFAALGSRVTVLARSGLLGGQEPFAGELVGAGLRDLGVDVRTGVSPTAIDRDASGTVRIALGDSADAEVVEADEVLVATGRVPRTGDLGLERFGLEPGAWLDTDDTLRVLGSDGAPLPGEWLYAAGDVTHRALLTHQGKYQARAAGDAIAARAQGTPVRDAPWARHVATADHAAVPQVAFTDPQVASVGLTAARAEHAGIATRVVDADLGGVAGASLHRDGYTGTARIVIDADRGVLVGATFVGPDVQELLHSATVAIVGEVPLERLWHAVPAYPTMSEVWLRLLEADGRSNADA